MTAEKITNWPATMTDCVQLRIMHNKIIDGERLKAMVKITVIDAKQNY